MKTIFKCVTSSGVMAGFCASTKKTKKEAQKFCDDWKSLIVQKAKVTEDAYQKMFNE